MSSERIAYRYDERQNPQGSHLDGVPLRDLTAADLTDLPEHVVIAILEMPFYVAMSGDAAEIPAAVASDRRRSSRRPAETKEPSTSEPTEAGATE